MRWLPCMHVTLGWSKKGCMTRLSMDLTQQLALSWLLLRPGCMGGGRARATASNTEALVTGCPSPSVFAAVALQQRKTLGMRTVWPHFRNNTVPVLGGAGCRGDRTCRLSRCMLMVLHRAESRPVLSCSSIMALWIRSQGMQALQSILLSGGNITLVVLPQNHPKPGKSS